MWIYKRWFAFTLIVLGLSFINRDRGTTNILRFVDKYLSFVTNINSTHHFLYPHIFFSVIYLCYIFMLLFVIFIIKYCVENFLILLADTTNLEISKIIEIIFVFSSKLFCCTLVFILIKSVLSVIQNIIIQRSKFPMDNSLTRRKQKLNLAIIAIYAYVYKNIKELLDKILLIGLLRYYFKEYISCINCYGGTLLENSFLSKYINDCLLSIKSINIFDNSFTKLSYSTSEKLSITLTSYEWNIISDIKPSIIYTIFLMQVFTALIIIPMVTILVYIAPYKHKIMSAVRKFIIKHDYTILYSCIYGLLTIIIFCLINIFTSENHDILICSRYLEYNLLQVTISSYIAWSILKLFMSCLLYMDVFKAGRHTFNYKKFLILWNKKLYLVNINYDKLCLLKEKRNNFWPIGLNIVFVYTFIYLCYYNYNLLELNIFSQIFGVFSLNCILRMPLLDKLLEYCLYNINSSFIPLFLNIFDNAKSFIYINLGTSLRYLLEMIENPSLSYGSPSGGGGGGPPIVPIPSSSDDTTEEMFAFSCFSQTDHSSLLFETPKWDDLNVLFKSIGMYTWDTGSKFNVGEYLTNIYYPNIIPNNKSEISNNIVNNNGNLVTALFYNKTDFSDASILANGTHIVRIPHMYCTSLPDGRIFYDHMNSDSTKDLVKTINTFPQGNFQIGPHNRDSIYNKFISLKKILNSFDIKPYNLSIQRRRFIATESGSISFDYNIHSRYESPIYMENRSITSNMDTSKYIRFPRIIGCDCCDVDERSRKRSNKYFNMTKDRIIQNGLQYKDPSQGISGGLLETQPLVGRRRTSLSELQSQLTLFFSDEYYMENSHLYCSTHNAFKTHHLKHLKRKVCLHSALMGKNIFDTDVPVNKHKVIQLFIAK